MSLNESRVGHLMIQETEKVEAKTIISQTYHLVECYRVGDTFCYREGTTRGGKVGDGVYSLLFVCSEDEWMDVPKNRSKFTPLDSRYTDEFK